MRMVAIASLLFAHAAMAGVVVQSVSIQGSAIASSGYQSYLDENNYFTVPYSESKTFTLDAAGSKSIVASGLPDIVSPSPGWVVLYGPVATANASATLDLSHGIELAASASVFLGSGSLDGITPQSNSFVQVDIRFDVTNSPASLSFSEPVQITEGGIPSANGYFLTDTNSGSILLDYTQSTDVSDFILAPGSYEFVAVLVPYLTPSGGMLAQGNTYGNLSVVPEASSIILAGFPLLGLFLWKRGGR